MKGAMEPAEVWTGNSEIPDKWHCLENIRIQRETTNLQ